MATALHVPVLREAWLALCPPQPGDTLLDATMGHGGHAQAFLEASGPTGRVVGLDADSAALAVAREQLAASQDRVQFVHSNFVRLKDSIRGGGILLAKQETREALSAKGQTETKRDEPPLFTHVLFDLGIGSHQLADPARGFSFQEGGSLRMQYGELTGLPPAELRALNILSERSGNYPDAQDLLRGLSAADLADVLYHYGEERYSRRIAAALKVAVQRQPALTAQELGAIVAAAVPASYERGRIHPATRTFQALRLAVNRELEALAAALPQALELLAPHGYLAVISFHSLEDRMVKHFLRRAKGQLVVLTKKPRRASPEEVARNPRARSAKLRVGRRAP